MLVVPGMAILILVVDQVSKHLVRTNLPVGQSWTIAPWLAPIVQITHVTNTGAAFGLLPGLSVVFAVVAVVVIVAILFYHRHLPQGQGLTRLALGLQLGGATGNLIDRLRFGGTVVDFLDVNFWPLRDWPVFNVADSSIVTGVTLLALQMLWEERQEIRGRPDEAEEPLLEESSHQQVAVDVER